MFRFFVMPIICVSPIIAVGVVLVLNFIYEWFEDNVS
jgi:hypothetical protein